jgi:hypothetical protein
MKLNCISCGWESDKLILKCAQCGVEDPFRIFEIKLLLFVLFSVIFILVFLYILFFMCGVLGT